MTEIIKQRQRRFYYKEKVMKLNAKLFIEVGDARSRICNCENEIDHVQIISQGIGLPIEVEQKWQNLWKELTANENAYWFDKRGQMIGSPVCGTIKRKANKTMKKYLYFFYEELLRVLDKDFI